jgi:hypothetical protein
MTDLLDALHEVDRALSEVVATTLVADATVGLSDDEVLEALAAAAGVRRAADAMMAELVGQIDGRADAAPHAERVTTVHGCRSVKELVQRVTLVSARTAGEFIRVGRGVARTTAPMTGERLDAAYPAMRWAAAEGTVGLDALVAVIATLDSAVCDRASRRAADEELAASASGTGREAGAGVGAAPSADELRLQASVWAMYLDQDGAEPRDARAMRRRGLSVGVCRDGLVPVRGALLPEVAAQLHRIFDSVLNPKTAGATVARPTFVDSETLGLADSHDPAGSHDQSDSLDPADSRGPEGPGRHASSATTAAPLDERTRAQKQHDALATALSVAARSGQLPTIGGSAPTLVVSVRSEDVLSDTGFAHVEACDEPVPLAVARQVACTGAVQRVRSDEHGRILAIDITDRVFAAHQRKAIALRDGGCIIPGCAVPASWCEIHHVEEAARGGPTHTDNGVLLCWFHHRTIDTGGWRVRMTHGVPEVRGPGWWDASRMWHPVTKSPIRLRDRRGAAARG